MKKLLITGFDPFGGESINPAWEAVRLLPDVIRDFELVKLEIPTVFGAAAQVVIDKAEEIHPDAIISVGQAGGRAAVTPEMVGINLRYASIPDNMGALPCDIPIAEGGPAAYFSTLPVRAMAKAICDAGLPGAVSYSAGSFVCNDVLYSLLHHFDETAVRAGFIHVPFLPEQTADKPSLPLEQTAAALRAAIEAI
mgnify:FL=1